MKQHEAARLAHAIQYHWPEFYNKVVSELRSQLNDTSLIPGFYDYYQNTRPLPLNRDQLFEFRLLFFCAILEMYDPGSLYYGLIISQKLSTLLANIFGLNHRQSTTNLKIQGRLFIKNPRFRDQVRRLCEEFKGL